MWQLSNLYSAAFELCFYKMNPLSLSDEPKLSREDAIL